MSFVGIRPERKHFADQLAKLIPYYDLRFLVKPGLTGWAQVNHGYSGSEKEQHEKFQYELFYLKKMSIQALTVRYLPGAKSVLVKIP